MLVMVLNFGTNWWARFGRDADDPYRFSRHAAYYNSTGVRCGSKIRRHWIVSGLLRFNGVGDFNPSLPDRAIWYHIRLLRVDTCVWRKPLAVSKQSPQICRSRLLSGCRFERHARLHRLRFHRLEVGFQPGHCREPVARQAGSNVVDEAGRMGADQQRLLAVECAQQPT
jgi:hypothetical protein